MNVEEFLLKPELRAPSFNDLYRVLNFTPCCLLHGRAIAPEFFQIVQIADRRSHYVGDDIAKIDQHPVANLLTFAADRFDALFA